MYITKIKANKSPQTFKLLETWHQLITCGDHEGWDLHHFVLAMKRYEKKNMN